MTGNNTPQQNVPVPEKEQEIIRSTFKDNEPLLQAIRALMFGLSPTSEEKERVRTAFANKELLTIVRRRFYPVLDKTSPIGQVQDAWMGAEQMVFGQSPSTVEQAIGYKEIALHMTKAGLDLLENPDAPAPELSYSKVRYPNDPLGVQLLARNQYIRHVEQQLLFLKLIADQKPPEQPNVREEKQKARSAK